MKKLTLVLAGLSIVFSGMTQKNKVVSAYNYEKSYQRSKRCSDLKKGLDAIEVAKDDEVTKTWAKTWRYRAKILWDIHTSDKCKSMFPDALNESFESYSKAFQLNFKNPEYKNMDMEKMTEEQQKKFAEDFKTGKVEFEDPEITMEFMQMMPSFGIEFINNGVTAYQNKNYEKAVEYFEKGIGAQAFGGKLDTAAMYYLAIAYEKAGKDSNAIETYKALTKMGYEGKGDGPKIYYYLSDLYKKQGNLEEAHKVIVEGRQKYPEDKALLTEEIDYYLKAGKDDEALKTLDEAITKDPNKAILYYARGTIYDKKGDVEKAAADYQKAIELDPENFDAYYNMGALYYNQGADYNNKANELPLDQTAKYDEFMKLSQEAFEKAIPYLEKANQLKPDDIATANTLIKLYTRTNQLEKDKALKAKYQ